MAIDGASSVPVTQLLNDWRDGDEKALARLMPAVYGELRRLASRYLSRERSDHTLQTAELVHEAYLRLVDQRRVTWKSRAHFGSVAAQMMRRILVDHARRRNYAKRGGGLGKRPFEEALEVVVTRPPELLALDEALTALERTNSKVSQVVELRVFGGLTNAEIAEVLAISIPTITRRWRTARAWLYRYLRERETHENRRMGADRNSSPHSR